MNKEGKDIGNLFKTGLQNYKAEISEEEWLATEIKVKGNNFFRFSVSNFNIYYCLLFLTSFVFSSIVFVDYFFFKEKTGKTVIKEQVTAPLKDSLDHNTIKPSTIENNKNETQKPAGNYKDMAYQQKLPTNTSSKNNIILSQDTANKIDNNVPTNSVTDNNNSASPLIKNVDSSAIQKSKTKKIVYITRQDTVRVYDTLDAKAKTKKRRKK